MAYNIGDMLGIAPKKKQNIEEDEVYVYYGGCDATVNTSVAYNRLQWDNLDYILWDNLDNMWWN